MSFRVAGNPSAPSEDLVPFHQAGSDVPIQPLDIDYWCQSIQCSALPPTPPDTISECSLPDYSDMAYSTGPWTSLPEDCWSTAPSAPEHSTWMPPANGDWHAQAMNFTDQDPSVLDPSPWLSLPGDIVDFDRSPVLRQESQSSHRLGTSRDSDIQSLPHGLDLSFVADPFWDAPAHFIYPSPNTVPEQKAVTPEMLTGVLPGPLQSTYPGTTSGISSAPHSLFHGQCEQVPRPQRIASDPSIGQRRPLLPRTAESSFLECHGQGCYPASKFLTSTGRGGLVSPSVSTASSSQLAAQHLGPPSPQYALFPGGHAVPGCAPLRPYRIDTPPTLDPAQGNTRQSPLSFVPLDQPREAAEAMTSYFDGSRVQMKQQTPSVQVRLNNKSESVPSQTRSSSGSCITLEGEEGRYRTHPLYNKGPESDGMYHCPFRSDPNCQHKPTKLKCNYDKFVDSHLKPFRCKIDACSKQEFSSTACLLRHEREAHGMHGHGDRPHLCLYPGCERGIPGNGFPRRYNLFDHMKRVHDHKEEAPKNVDTSEPSLSRKAGGRKRKAMETEVPTARVSKMPRTQQPSPPLSMDPTRIQPNRPGNFSHRPSFASDGAPAPCAQPLNQRQALLGIQEFPTGEPPFHWSAGT